MIGPPLLPRSVVTGAAVVVVLLWGASQVRALLDVSYSSPAALHAALMLILGAVFAQKRGDPKDEPGEKDDPAAPPGKPADPPAGPPPPGPPRRESFAEMMARLQAEQRERDERGGR